MLVLLFLLLYNCCMEKEIQIFKKLLESKKLSVYAFAKDINVDVQVVQNWIYRNGIPKKKLVQVAEYFGVSVDYLLGR